MEFANMSERFKRNNRFSQEYFWKVGLKQKIYEIDNG